MCVQLNLSVYSAGKMTRSQTFGKAACWLASHTMLRCFTLRVAKSWHCIVLFTKNANFSPSCNLVVYQDNWYNWLTRVFILPLIALDK